VRQIVLDTETTGLEHEQGHRIIEVGAVELMNRRRTGRTFHRYFCPDRAVDPEALKVHGITNEFLAAQPRFADGVHDLLEFLQGAELIIHNAVFDVSFLDAEFRRIPNLNRTVADMCKIVDTLLLARRMHPGQRNSLDALCKRYEIDNSQRDLHGALLDSQILLEVYLAMTGGQSTLVLGEVAAFENAANAALVRAPRPAGELRVIRAEAHEVEAHQRSLAAIDKASGGKTVWRALLEAASVVT
jgi:DNA polymerase-3 subunit epsilon